MTGPTRVDWNTVATHEALDEALSVLARVLDPADPGSVVVSTSGSSGNPKQVELPGPALRASGEATAEVLGGHGRWVLALSAGHVAGLQVLARSVLAGTSPVVLPEGPFTPEAFADAVDALNADRTDHAPLRLTSLVPTQVHRLLDSSTGRRALAGLDVVLLGGAAAAPDLLARAREHTRVVTTYGMSETCGGCVYDGRPLPGVRVRLDPEDGRISLGGPVVAAGYVSPGAPADRFGTEVVEGRTVRWFRTDDHGVLTDGRLRVRGRLDSVVVTGGHKVEPADVEAALRRLPGITDALVVGLPDPEWGELVGAVLVTAPGTTTTFVRDLLARHAPDLPAHARPRRVVVSARIPSSGIGKPDRSRARELLTGGRMEPHPR